jgi:hypothetical protein
MPNKVYHAYSKVLNTKLKEKKMERYYIDNGNLIELELFKLENNGLQGDLQLNL